MLLLARRVKIVFWEAFGYADPDDKKPFKKDTVVFLASTTKPIAATAIMTLVDDGVLALDDPVFRYLPEFKTLTLEDGSTTTTPTIRQLLSHTSGWSGNQEMSSDGTDACRDVSLTMKESASLIAGDKLLARPGQRFSYGPLSFQVAGRAAEVTSGKSFDQLIQQKVFLPLGMTDTTFRPTPEQGERVAGIFKPMPWGAQLNLFRYDPDLDCQLSLLLKCRNTRSETPRWEIPRIKLSTATDWGGFVKADLILRQPPTSVTSALLARSAG